MLIVNLVLFIIFWMTFEANKEYKHIYLKRLISKFKINNRVPDHPPAQLFGWLTCMNNITENDILIMVGLDAYMLLRYHTVCLKFAVFLTFWGLLVLTPLYCTAAITQDWDRYTLTNVLNGDKDIKFRLWVPAVAGYIFSAYFCQLLYAEYSNFARKRLEYLVQTDPKESAFKDPDTPPQKYYTVMVERIPNQMRSAKEIHDFFNKLFPGEVI